MHALAFGITTLASACMAQHGNAQTGSSPTSKPFMLVTWFGAGAIELPNGGGWKPQLLTVYDDGRRPVAQFSRDDGVAASFILFENLSGKPLGAGCREDVIGPIVRNAQLSGKRVDGEAKAAGGEPIETSAFVTSTGIAAAPHERNLFGFEGDAKTCAEIHISTMHDTADAEQAMEAVLGAFEPNLDYRPTAEDDFRMASVLFKNAPGVAAPYYKASLDALPGGSESTTMRRVITDQLVMSLGMSGDLKASRAVAERAIAKDPDYPINYYNLACADAERGEAAAAKAHLQQAFDRRANAIKGEGMPDPTQDESIQKLRKNKEFWAFVTALPKN